MRPTSLREVAARTRIDGDWDHHLRNFLDHVYLADGDTAQQETSIAASPDLLGEPEVDAVLGGAGEHLARRWGLAIPGWVRDDARYLRRAMFYPDEPALRGYLMGASPVAFRVRLIFTGPEPLQRARFPYHRGLSCIPVAMSKPAGRETPS